MLFSDRNTATFDQGFVPSICLSEVQENGNAAGGTTNGQHRLRSSSKSTSNLESETAPKAKPAMISRSTSDLGSEVKMDLGAETSIMSSSSDQYNDDPSENN